MVLLDLLLLVCGTLLFIFVLAQVILPLIFGTPLFPVFGTRLKKDLKEAEHGLENVAEAEALEAMQDEINARRAKLKGNK